jgi:hypothetical protein
MVAIISRAQQARPKVQGQMEFFLAQLITVVRLVVMMLSP